MKCKVTGGRCIMQYDSDDITVMFLVFEQWFCLHYGTPCLRAVFELLIKWQVELLSPNNAMVIQQWYIGVHTQIAGSIDTVACHVWQVCLSWLMKPPAESSSLVNLSIHVWWTSLCTEIWLRSISRLSLERYPVDKRMSHWLHLAEMLSEGSTSMPEREREREREREL